MFQPSTPDPAPARDESSPAPPEGEIEKLKEKEPQTQGESTGLSLALSLGQSTGSLGTYPPDAQAGGDNAESHGQSGDSKSEKRPSLVDRQASTVEYLPGMLHSNCPKGLLPKFSSWSLVKLGPAKAYNFHTGLDQQGFIPGTNYLMPWDIVIRTRTEDEGDLDTNSWPAPNKAVPAKRSSVVMGRGRRRDDIARAFVGFEYEDARGRRFMCSGPDKVMKVMGGGPKESAIKALNSDMPLYILSSTQGRGLKPHYAQFMRLFVVVPDAPLQITLTPQVRNGKGNLVTAERSLSVTGLEGTKVIGKGCQRGATRSSVQHQKNSVKFSKVVVAESSQHIWFVNRYFLKLQDWLMPALHFV